MGVQSTKLELRLIAEKMRNRFSVPRRLEGTSWSPKVLDLPPGDRFLVVCPHPDDDAVGCGGTIVKLVNAGKEVRVVYLSMQDGDFTPASRRQEITAALDRLGVKDHYLREFEFPSTRDATTMIYNEIMGYRPDAVFVPSPFENHDQHLRTFEAFMHATAGMEGPDAIMYEIWGTLMPNLLIPVSEVMPQKVLAILEHYTQVKDIDYVQVAQGMNGYRAATCGLTGYAEAFMYLPAAELQKVFY